MTNHRCDNCGHEFSDRELEELGKVFPGIPGLRERLDPGGIVPSGECPNCGALCYPTDYRFVPKEIETALKDIVQAYDELGGEIGPDLRQLIEDARKLLESQH